MIIYYIILILFPQPYIIDDIPALMLMMSLLPVSLPVSSPCVCYALGGPFGISHWYCSIDRT